MRKTKDEWVLLGDYGLGYEEVLTEETKKEIRQRKKEYEENEPQYSFMIGKRRIYENNHL